MKRTISPNNGNGKSKMKALVEFQNLATAMIERSRLAGRLGKSFGTTNDDRELYTALGYPLTLDFERFQMRYRRQDIAKRIVDAYPNATWSIPPTVYETESNTDETPFEKSWNALLEQLRVFYYMLRIDKVAGIGQYACLFLGFNDGRDFSKPVKKADKLLYLKTYDESEVQIGDLVTDTSSPRYGLPESYRLQMVTEPGGIETTVHHTRVLHVADDTDDSDIYGVPRLEVVYNRLMNLEMLSGGSAEMFWRGAFPGYAFEMPADVTLSDADKTAMGDQIEEYFHKLNRYLRLKGIETKQLSPQVSSPKEHIDIQYRAIAGATGIPLRILTGSERGELASSQDRSNWETRVNERRNNFAEPVMLRPFVDRLIEAGVLTAPKDKYLIKWPDVEAMTERERVDIADKKSDAIRKYASAPGAEYVVPVGYFRTKVLGFSQEESDKMDDSVKSDIEDEVNDTVVVEPVVKPKEKKDE